MKKISFILLFSVILFYAEGQTRTAGKFIPAKSNPQTISVRSAIDTLIPSSFVAADHGGLGCFTGIYTAPDSGYVSGNNQYGDQAMAQFMSISKFTADTESHFLQEVLVNFGLKTVSDTPENVIVNIFESVSGVPGDLLTTSIPVNLAEINTGQWTPFLFPEVVTLPDSFFMSIQMPVRRGDTLAVLTSQDPCRQFQNWSWTQWKDFSWHSIYHAWILDIDLAIAPIVELGVTGVNEVSNRSRALLFPNPANDLATLQLTNGQKISGWQLMDESGRILVQQNLSPEKQNEFLQIPLKNFPAGLYWVKWQSRNANGTLPLLKN